MAVKKPKTWMESELMCIGKIVFKLWVTPDGDLLSEVKPVALVNDDEVKTQIACMVASIQEYISTGMKEDVAVKKAKLDRLVEMSNIQTVPDIIKWQKKLPFEEKKTG